MKKFIRNLIVIILVVFFMFGLVGSPSAFAATDPGLGASATFSVFAQTAITGTATISGDVGINSTGAGITALTAGNVGGTIYSTNGVAPGLAILAPTVQTNLSTANDNISGQGSTGSIGPVLDGLVLTTGVYDIGAGRLNGGVLTLNGPGIYIFRASSDLVSSGSINLTNGARACDVYWQVNTLATIDGASFVGTIIAGTGVHFGANVTLNGRALALGGDVTMINNTISGPTCAAAPAIINVIKHVINNNGGINTAGDFTLTIGGVTAVGGNTVTGAESPGVDKTLSTVGAYTVTEAGLTGYSQSSSADCSGTIAAGETKTCTITNNDQAPSLTLNKIVVNDNGGIAAESAWTLTATGLTTISGPGAAGSADVVSGATFSAGTYTLSESVGPAGYAASSWSCVKNGGAPASGASVTLGLGDVATCTITNNDIPVGATQLTVTKIVVNDNGGTKVISDFPLFIDGVSVASGVVNTTSVGLHTVSETADSGYAATIGGHCAANGTITLAPGDVKICTITNNDIPVGATQLTVTKIVVNDNGGTKVISDFPLFIDGVSVASGVVNTTSVGLHTVSETADSGYAATIGGHCAANGTITLAPGDVKICTITNNDIAPRLTVTKIVVNDNGGTKVISDFPLFIDGISVVSGVASTTSAGLHTVSETSDSGYTHTFSGDCDVVDGHVDLIMGDNKFCIITNNDIAPAVLTPSSSGGGSSYIPPVPPLIDVVKVPNPLALPDGSGLVTYTYTLRNIGTVTMSNITMVGDTCSPIALVSGDINANAKLEVNETWIYQCATTLSETHTNTVVATGWANGLSAIDIASATVVVGAPIVPPLIHVTKVPNPLTLSAGAGMVTYTERITNPGTVALNNISLTDDKCSPIIYISGDTNSDSKLDTTETWTYTCQTNLTKTTTNTAIASGEANGIVVRDFAIATVVVAAVAAAPALPNAGLPLDGSSTPWNVVILAGIFMLISTLLVLFIKKRTI